MDLLFRRDSESSRVIIARRSVVGEVAIAIGIEDRFSSDPDGMELILLLLATLAASFL